MCTRPSRARFKPVSLLNYLPSLDPIWVRNRESLIAELAGRLNSVLIIANGAWAGDRFGRLN